MTEIEFTTFLRDNETIQDKKKMDINLFSTKKSFYFNYVISKDQSYNKILISVNDGIIDLVASATYTDNRLEYIYVDKNYRKTNLVDMLVFILKQKKINTANLIFKDSKNGRGFIRNYGFRCK